MNVAAAAQTGPRPMRRWLIAAGVLAFVAGLVVGLPARVAYDWFAPPGVGLRGIEGSIWSGSAREASAGALYLTGLDWRLAPFSLLRGRLAFDVDADAGAGTIAGRVALAPGGNVFVSGLDARLPLDIFAGAIAMPGLRGTASVVIERLHIDDGLPVSANGLVEVRGLVVPTVDPAPIGGYRAAFYDQGDSVVATVEDTDGLLDLNGNLEISPDRSYRFLGLVAPKPETPEKLRRQLRMLGSPDESGQREIRLEGTL